MVVGCGDAQLVQNRRTSMDDASVVYRYVPVPVLYIVSVKRHRGEPNLNRGQDRDKQETHGTHSHKDYTDEPHKHSRLDMASRSVCPVTETVCSTRLLLYIINYIIS